MNSNYLFSEEETEVQLALGRRSAETILERGLLGQNSLSMCGKKLTLNIWVQICEQKNSGKRQGAKERHPSFSPRRTGSGWADIHTPTAALVTRGTESKKRYLLPIYINMWEKIESLLQTPSLKNPCHGKHTAGETW